MKTYLEQIDSKLDFVIALLGTVLRKERRIMATLDQVLADTTDEATLDDSIITLLTGIKKQLDDALANSITPAQQAQIDQIFTNLEANKVKVAAAITANTPVDTGATVATPVAASRKGGNV
jgi:hypothetical protein